MDTKEVGKLTLTIAPEALRTVISSGRLLELSAALSAEAARQISAQLVEQVAAAALKPESLKAGAAINVSYIFDGGDFGTVPPRPHWGVVAIDEAAQAGLLRQVAQVARTGTGG
jgi:hypothetical protein